MCGRSMERPYAALLPPAAPAHEVPVVSPHLPRQRAAGSSTVRRRCSGASPQGTFHPRNGLPPAS